MNIYDNNIDSTNDLSELIILESLFSENQIFDSKKANDLAKIIASLELFCDNNCNYESLIILIQNGYSANDIARLLAISSL